MLEKLRFALDRVSNEPHLLADAAELALLFEEETHYIGWPDIKGMLTDGGLDDDVEEEEDNLETQERDIASCFEQLEYRAGAFGDNYPFEVKAGNALTLRPEQVTNTSAIYLFLLIASRLKYFSPKCFIHRVSKEFELVSKEAMQQMLPDGAEVVCFDHQSQDRERIGKKLKDSVPRLAEMMGVTLREGWKKKFDQLKSSSDLQIDIAGAVRFDDKATGHLVILAQCKAQEEDWKEGTTNIVEATKDAALFNHMHTPQTALFISPCYRQSDGKWVEERRVEDVLLLDRLRILNLLKKAPPMGLVQSRLSALAQQFPSCSIAQWVS